ncbi:MAG: hypothetical protein FJ315_06200 [SAR202 cluster bacterium]|nr:hypothetical protein [SAR202 cluster bacterium]
MAEQQRQNKGSNPPKLTVGSPGTLEAIAASLQAIDERLLTLEKQHAGLLKAYQETVPRLLEDYKHFISSFNDSMESVKEFEQAIVEAFNGQTQSLGHVAEFCRQNFGILQRSLLEHYPEVQHFAELEEAGAAPEPGPASGGGSGRLVDFLSPGPGESTPPGSGQGQTGQ